MIYFDSDMSKSTNTAVYFDWKTVIYIYACGKCRTQIMLPILEQTIIHQHVHLRRKSQSHGPAHVLMRLYQYINRSFVYKAKEGSHVRILNIHVLTKEKPSFYLFICTLLSSLWNKKEIPKIYTKIYFYLNEYEYSLHVSDYRN